MREIDQDSFVTYLRGQWAQDGIDVGEEGPTPHRDQEQAGVERWSFGVAVARGSSKARVGVWLLPPGKTINDLPRLRAHYQGTLQKQNRFVHITSCPTELGVIFLFFDATQPLPEAEKPAWNALVGACTQGAFDGDALGDLLDRFTV